MAGGPPPRLKAWNSQARGRRAALAVHALTSVLPPPRSAVCSHAERATYNSCTCGGRASRVARSARATNIARSAMFESLRGQFLVAGKALRDPNFYKSVVLLLEHGPGGALGLVVNRPTAVKVSTALGGQIELPEQHDRLYVGGPVQSSALFIMHNGPKLQAASHEVGSGLYVATSPEALEEVVRAASSASDAPLKFRLFSGCAGWGPGQLEGELARADWHLRPAAPELLFDSDAHALWDALLRQAYDAQRLI